MPQSQRAPLLGETAEGETDSATGGTPGCPDLLQSPGLLQLLADGIGEPVFMKDSDGRYVLINRAGAAACRRAPEEMIGRTDAELFPPPVAAELRAHDLATLAGGRPEVVEESFAVGGALIRHLVTKLPCRDAGGRVCGLLGIVRDLSPRPGGVPLSRSEADRLTSIIELQQAVGTAGLDPEAVMQRIADRARDLLDATGAAVLIGEGSDMAFRATSGAASVVRGCRMPAATSLAGQSFLQGLPLRVDDAEADPRVFGEVSRRVGTRSILTVPLRDGRQTIGVLVVMHERPAAFSERDLQALLLIGGMLSAALARALAFDANRRLLEERTATLAALRESEERLQSAMRAAQIGVWVWDVAGDAITWLGEHEVIFGMPTAGAGQRYAGFMERVHPEDRPALERAVTASLTSGTEFEHSYRVVRPDKTVRWVTGRGQFHFGPDGAPVRMFGAVMDVTERRALEHQVLQAQKIEAIGQLAAGIAHEINTPTQYVGDNLRFLQDSYGGLLAVLEQYRLVAEEAAGHGVSLGAVDRAWRDADGDFVLEEVPRALTQALDGVERVTQIVRAMKDFSHPGEREPVPVDLNRAIANTVTVSRNEWKYVADLELALAPDLPPVPCLAGEIQQVLLNLVVNAAHAIGDVIAGTDRKGRITISTAVAEDIVEVRVHDTGAGIPPEVQPRIFEPFFTTKEVGKGTGQGLALSRDVIVRKHRGTLGFETEAGRGTTFIIRLPLHPDDVLAERA